MATNQSSGEVQSSPNDDIIAQDSEKKMEEEPLRLCGVGSIRPACLQPCNRVGVFSAAASVMWMLTTILPVYLVTQITAIEKHFGLSSSQSGFLLSCNDLGFLGSSMFVSYAARRVHIPRSLFVSTIVFGIGALICSIPYFVTKESVKGYLENNSSERLSVSASKLCMDDDAPLSSGTPDCISTEDTFVIGLPNQYSVVGMVLIAAGMAVQGIVKSTRFPFTVTYLDDNGKKKNTAMYIGIMFSSCGLAGPTAFALGAIFSRLYVIPGDVTISPRHPSWIGAWWLGFLVFGALSLVASFPLLCFPRHMKRQDSIKEKSSRASGIRAVYKHIIAFISTICRLVTNPVYIMVVISHALRIFINATFLSFASKYLETQFTLTAWKANISMSIIAVVPSIVSPLVSGLIVTKRRLPPLQCIKLMVVASVVCTLLQALGFVIGCGNIEHVGRSNATESLMTNKSTLCGESCRCNPDVYFPVCGSDGRNYFSPCEAGCMTDLEQVYVDCRCIGNNATATPGLCETKCPMLIPFVILFVVQKLIELFTLIPAVIVQIRSVSDKDKAMCLGLSTVFNTLAWLSAPVILGRAVDSTCIVWSASCDSKGACALYDNDSFRFVKTLVETVPGIIVCILMVLIFLVARNKTDWSENPTDTTTMATAIGSAADPPSREASNPLLTTCSGDTAM